MNKNNLNPIVKRSKRTKSIVLSVVALLELIFLLTSVTFSWFEGLTSLEMQGDEIKSAANLNSHIEFGESKDATDSTRTEIINLTTFFDAQKEVRLSPVSSSDAVNFYAEYEAGKYRKLTNDDINANIIQFDFTVDSPDGTTDVYLTEVLPVVTIAGEACGYNNSKATPFRYAFSDGTTTHILRVDNVTDTTSDNSAGNQPTISSLNDDNTAETTTGIIERAQNFAYKTTGDNSAVTPLFHLDKDETKIITVSVWLDALDTGYADSGIQPGNKISFDVSLCTTWSIPKTITVYDYSASHSINNSSNMVLYARNADSKDRLYKFSYTADTYTWSGSVPTAVENFEFIWAPESSTPIAVSSWTAGNCNGYDYITMLGNSLDSSACVWGLGPDDLTKITFRDYTSKDWVYNDNASMYINVPYNDTTLNYKMTDTPLRDSTTNNKDTWSCYIPTSVTSVQFDRCQENTPSTVYNYWTANKRNNGETIYVAKDGTATSSTKTVYLQIDSSNQDLVNIFTYNDNTYDTLLAISETNTTNNSVWNSYSGNLANLPIKGDPNNHTTYPYYYPGADQWQKSAASIFTKVSDNLWKYDFSSAPSDGDKITVWAMKYNKSNGPSAPYNYNDVAPDMSLGVFEFNSSNNLIYINGFTRITVSGNNNNNALTGYITSSSSVSSSYGEWLKEIPTKPSETGTYTTYVNYYDANVSAITATFTFEGMEYTLNLEKSATNSNEWSTIEIPDSVTSVTFSDGTNSWTASGRSKSNNLFCIQKAVNNSIHAYWAKEIKLVPGQKWNQAGAWFAVNVTGGSESGFDVKFTENNGVYSAFIPKDTTILSFKRMASGSTTTVWDSVTNVNVVSDSNTYTITYWNSGTWYYQTKIYLKPNSNWTQANAWFAARFWDTETNKEAWVKLTDADGDGIYEATIPTDNIWTHVIFTRMNPASTSLSWSNCWNQTADQSLPTNGNNYLALSTGSNDWSGIGGTWSKK